MGHLPIAMTYIPHQKKKKEDCANVKVSLHDQFVTDLHVHKHSQGGGTPAAGSRRGCASGSGKGARVLKGEGGVSRLGLAVRR